MSADEFSSLLARLAARGDSEALPEIEQLRAAYRAVREENERLRLEKRELLDELEATTRGTMELTAELEARYQNLFENAVEGIYQTTPDADRYLVANPAMAAVLGYDSVADLYRSVGSIRDDVFLDFDRYEEYRESLRAARTLDDFEYRIRRGDGEIRWLSDSTTALVDEDGELEGIQGGVVDITARKERERRLEDNRDKLNVLNQLVRHDIRNDMNVVIGWARVLEAELTGEEADALARILETSDHVVEVTNVVRDFVASLAAETDLDAKAVDVTRILESELGSQRAAYPDARFHALDEHGPILVRADEMLSSVFQNLFHNAVQHSDKDTPEVRTTVEESEGSVVVRIADNGPGIPENQRERLFGLNERGLESEGSGVGLYLVRELVDQYRGAVWVEDNDPEGAVFAVELRTVAVAP